MLSRHPDHETIRAALALAVRAPSVHNTQPWQWRVGDTTVHLYADETRRLALTDPDGRDLLLSCGAALHHFRVAMRSFGWHTVVHRLPNPAEPQHLASIEFSAATPTADVVELTRAINHRRTDRRRTTSWEVPRSHIDAIRAAGDAEGALVSEIPGGQHRTRLVRAFETAAAQHRDSRGYQAELAAWSGRHAALEGVPSRNAVLADDPLTREFHGPTLVEAVLHDLNDRGDLLLVHTASDDRISRLRAGEAASAALLTATSFGLATCPLTEPFEVPGTRDLVRADVLSDSGFPQLIIRIGWAATSAAKVPPTPRRPLADVVRSL
ncbi:MULTISPECIES: nitroreductase family protein [unclassified Nocardia]|uniref:Acg family FMN-binding oxidoreductase n=1 Tax=unclassified Nocardia TaxID=2637762 RepID=UPI001CE40591|nr:MULTISPECIES: nitroreductase family protein [unclassified Nocardia]